MSKNSKIEWCDHTFNPWIGCTKISPACDNCYAEAMMDKRVHVVQWGAGNPRKRTSISNWKEPIKWNAEAQKLGKRYRVFCASLADIFDNEVPTSWRTDLFDLIELTPSLDWLLLTKRIGNASEMIARAKHNNWLRENKNVWLGVTICNQEEADRDIPKLLDIPAMVRFLSIEPLLGKIDLYPSAFNQCVNAHNLISDPETGAYECCSRCEYTGVSNDIAIDWVIVGGESGQNARPMHPDWVRSLRDQCKDSGTPFLFKQWGEWAPYDRGMTDSTVLATPCSLDMPPQKFGKKLSGRMLDGIEHTEYPKGVL
jgi:protein gp37